MTARAHAPARSLAFGSHPLHRTTRGPSVYKCLDDDGLRWRRHLIDEGGVAVEDLACTDLDGDGKIDIVAVGRATGNVRIYRNVTKR